jgi:hypothetical protein
MADGFNNKPPVGQQVVDNLLGGNIGGIISTRQIAKYMSGARTTLRINGKIIGFAFGIQWRIQTSFTEIDTIDDPLPAELAPRRIQVDGSISALHIPGRGAGEQLWQADVLSFLFHQYLNIEVRDSQTNELLFFAPKAVITSRAEDLKVDDLAQVSLTFQAIGYRDEKTPERPDGINNISTDAKTDTGDKNAFEKLQDSASGLLSSIGNLGL